MRDRLRSAAVYFGVAEEQPGNRQARLRTPPRSLAHVVVRTLLAGVAVTALLLFFGAATGALSPPAALAFGVVGTATALIHALHERAAIEKAQAREPPHRT